MIFNTKSGMIVSGKVGTVNAPKETASGKRYMTFSVAGAYEDGQTVWANCKAWNDMVDIAVLLAKGDCAIVTGRVEEREYNGKQYKDLIADCIIGMNHSAMDAREPDGYGVPDVPAEDDGSLPF